MKKMIIASTSTLYGSGYLEYLLPTLQNFYKHTDEIIFIPFARPGGISYDEYTKVAAQAFAKIDKKVVSIHEFTNKKEALVKAKGIFTGGGNTFELVNKLYQFDLMQVLRDAVTNGANYLGTSAGSNICGINMKNTNDMPIVYPPSFKTLGLIPFNINPHYQDPVENSTHMGETRETRIKEFHEYNDTPVLGLREGSWLEVINDEIILKGNLTARCFEKNKVPVEIQTESRICF